MGLKLAQHLEFQVVPLTEFDNNNPQEVPYFHEKKGQAEFSAVTLCAGSDRVIIHNDAHRKKRQAAKIAHELSHGLLNHLSRPLLNDAGVRHYDRAVEEEAKWPGPSHFRRGGLPDHGAQVPTLGSVRPLRR